INITRIVWQTVRRLTYEILGVKGYTCILLKRHDTLGSNSPPQAQIMVKTSMGCPEKERGGWGGDFVPAENTPKNTSHPAYDKEIPGRHDFVHKLITQDTKQLLAEVEHDIMKYQCQDLSYLPEEKAEVDNADVRFDKNLNFSLQCKYNIKRISDENKEKHQLGDYKLIQSQILQTNITST
ncbi:hypothetical protein pdam_00002213, partial [Pocillopora damicornis]